jgi:hypothetical protein
MALIQNGPDLLPRRASVPVRNVAERQIIAVIGVHLSRADLIHLSNVLGWNPLTRTEKE